MAFDELPGSPLYSGNGAERRATRRGLIPWGDINAHFGSLFPLPIGGIPQVPAQLTGAIGMYADQVSYEPHFGGNERQNGVDGNGIETYDRAIATITYKTMTFTQEDPESSQIITRRIDIGAEYLTLPELSLKWENGGEPVQTPDVRAGKLIGMLTHCLTFHRVPNPPYSTIRSLVGKVNSSTFEGAVEESMLFLGAQFTQVVTSDGSQPWEITMQFSERNIDGTSNIGWNHFYKPTGNEKGTWQRLVTAAGDPIYPSGDFNSIF